MDFGKQIYKTHYVRSHNNSDKMTTQGTTHTDDADMTNEVAGQQTTDTSNAEPTSTDFSNLTANMVDNPYKRRPSC